jgi:hypothetical protein
VAVSCVHGNEHSGSLKGGKVLDQLSDCLLVKTVYAPLNS